MHYTTFPHVHTLVTLPQKLFITITKYGGNGQTHERPKHRMAFMKEKPNSRDTSSYVLLSFKKKLSIINSIYTYKIQISMNGVNAK